MQVTKADPINSKRVGVEEEFIKFRPSPNFKNMKKFLKSRSECTETSSPVKHNVAPEPPLTKPELREEQKPVVVQPPLPPYPPPPDSPPNLNIIIKQEKEDDVENCTRDELSDINNEEQTLPQQPEASSEKMSRKPMCKEYIRGNCKRAVCKFAHEVDVSQLRGVFTFCWQYQNEECTFPNCRFVHADVFEEAEFYRTGILPPHARAHHKKVLPPPPPPQESQPDVQLNFSNPPPALHPSVEKPPPIISCIPVSNMEARNINEDFRATIPRSTSPLKREWSDVDNFSSSPRDLEPTEHLPKKCKNCEIMEFRLQFNKEKVENMMKSAEDNKKKLALLNKKSSKLTTVLHTLMKPAYNSKSGVNNGIMGNEKEKTIMEQLNNFVSPNNRLSSVINEDNVKVFNNILGSNINLSNLMAKLLCSTGDQNLSQDSSRET